MISCVTCHSANKNTPKCKSLSLTRNGRAKTATAPRPFSMPRRRSRKRVFDETEVLLLFRRRRGHKGGWLTRTSFASNSNLARRCERGAPIGAGDWPATATLPRLSFTRQGANCGKINAKPVLFISDSRHADSDCTDKTRPFPMRRPRNGQF